MQCKGVTPWDRAQRFDGKNGVIFLVAIFDPRVRVIKMSQIAHFLYFLLMTGKKVVKIRGKYLMHQKDLIH